MLENRIVEELEDLNETMLKVLSVWRESVDIQNQLLDEIRQLRHQMFPDMPDNFRIKETSLSKGETNMAEPNRKATVDLTTLDDGKGVLFTLTSVRTNPDGTTTPTPLPAGTSPITGTSSDPALSPVRQDPGDPTATPPRPADTTGLVFLGSIALPPKDVTGIVVTFSATLPNGTVISSAADPVDIVPDPNNANNPTGFTVVESNA